MNFDFGALFRLWLFVYNLFFLSRDIPFAILHTFWFRFFGKFFARIEGFFAISFNMKLLRESLLQ